MVAHVGGRRQINPLAYWQFDALEQGATVVCTGAWPHTFYRLDNEMWYGIAGKTPNLGVCDHIE
jgi:hypothetical protein